MPTKIAPEKKGNKGEWGELYVLCKLLADGELKDEEGNKMPIIAITRVEKEEEKEKEIHYVIERDVPDKSYKVQVFEGKYVKDAKGKRKPIKAITHVKEKEKEHTHYIIAREGEEENCSIKHNKCERDSFSGDSEELLKIVSSTRGTFSIETSLQKSIMNEHLHCTAIKAGSDTKTDIFLLVHDPMTNSSFECGFSIKSNFGAAPTLLNPCAASDFTYCIEFNGFPEDKKRIIKKITDDAKTSVGKSKGEKLLKSIQNNGGKLIFSQTSDKFMKNLLMIDSKMHEILSYMVLYYFSGMATSCVDLSNLLEKNDPLHFHREGIYTYKIKNMLYAAALGLTPAKEWDGQEDANGGYITASREGDVSVRHLYDRDKFKQFLLDNTVLCPPKTHDKRKKCLYGELYINDEDGKIYLNLRLQIRFKAEGPREKKV